MDRSGQPRRRSGAVTYRIQATLSSTTVVNLNAEKSVGVVAFILTFLFGPLRLFYATVTGGVVMLAGEVFLAILGFVTLGWAGYCSGQPGSSPSI